MSHGDHCTPCATCGASFAGNSPGEAIQTHDMFAGHPYAPEDMTRDMYNETILAEAQAFQEANDDCEYDDQEFDTDRHIPEYRIAAPDGLGQGTEVDNDEGFEEGDSTDDQLGDAELDAQILLVGDLMAAEAPHAEIDTAVDHLRGMLTISYCDDSDLPAPVQR